MDAKKQTAVEWLVEKLPIMDKYGSHYVDILQQAKAMEKEQIIDAYAQGFIESETMDKGVEQYYNETFKSE